MRRGSPRGRPSFAGGPPKSTSAPPDAAISLFILVRKSDWGLQRKAAVKITHGSKQGAQPDYQASRMWDFGSTAASPDPSKHKTAHPEREVEPCLSFHRNRLQNKRAFGATDQ